MIHGPYNPRPYALNDPSIGLNKAPVPVGPNYFAKVQGEDGQQQSGISPNYPGKLTYYYAGGFKPGPQGYPAIPESRTPEKPYGLNAPDTSRLDLDAIIKAGNRAGDNFIGDQSPQGYTWGSNAPGAGPSDHRPSSADSFDDNYRPVA